MISHKEIIKCLIGAVLVSCTCARPNQNEVHLKSSAQSPLSPDTPPQLPAHGRNEVGDEILEYYGGARGKILVISPSGKMTIRGQSHPPGAARPDEEDVGVASEETDSVAVDQPPDSASIAEAKPIAVSVAGVGGTASAQPIATAIVGPGGLALTRPVATAVAGIKGVEGIASVLGGKKSPGSSGLASILKGQLSSSQQDSLRQQPIYLLLPGQF